MQYIFQNSYVEFTIVLFYPLKLISCLNFYLQLKLLIMLLSEATCIEIAFIFILMTQKV